MKYIIISDENLDPIEFGTLNMKFLDKDSGLIARVSKLISNGWSPQGGVSYGAGKYLQALTIDEEE
tara:strand:- start:1081 stop:1278 length:198 start_codon:yes stop_codon:yes gene_type:complete